MDVNSINRLSEIGTYRSIALDNREHNTGMYAFDSVLQSAMDLVNETSALTDNAKETALNFAMGKIDNVHEVTIAQQKALTSLQYTVAVKNAVMEAYKEIMQLQF